MAKLKVGHYETSNEALIMYWTDMEESFAKKPGVEDRGDVSEEFEGVLSEHDDEDEWEGRLPKWAGLYEDGDGDEEEGAGLEEGANKDAK